MFIMDFWEWIYSGGINIDCVLCIKETKSNQGVGKAIRIQVVAAVPFFDKGPSCFRNNHV